MTEHARGCRRVPRRRTQGGCLHDDDRLSPRACQRGAGRFAQRPHPGSGRAGASV